MTFDIQNDATPAFGIISFAYGRVSSRAGKANGHTPGVSRQEQSIEIQDGQFQDYIRSSRIPLESFGAPDDRGKPANFFLERHSGFAKKGDIRKRPAGAKLWAAITAARGQFPDAQMNLIFTKVDRIGRDQLEIMILHRDLRELRVRMHIILLGGQAFDCDSPAGQLIITVLGWAAQNEVANTQTRILEGIQHKREHGEQVNGSTPYGWDAIPTGEIRRNKGGKDVVIKRLVANRTEQKWILHMQRLRETPSRGSAGWGYRRIARDLNRRGSRAKMGGPWRAGAVEKVLNNKTTTAWLASRA
jgi:DNA invertase Pin-like site-specific DNA recombinase